MKKSVAFLSLSASILFALTSCGPSVGVDELFYPDQGYAELGKDSWLQKDEEQIKIDWFVDMAAWGTAALPGTKVGDLIEKKTGIKINFFTPVTDDGSQLSTMISSGKLPDVITVNGGADTRIQLGEDNYTYPLEKLAEKYAPSLLARIDKDVKDSFVQSDGYIHGLPNHFYTQDDLKSYEQQEGKKLLTNGAMVCRKDYLDAYLNANPTSDPTTPEGFKQMALWVKDTYKLSNGNPTVMLDQFNRTGSTALTWLQEYFMVAPETKDGKLAIPYEQPENKEMYMWLNDLYRNKLISTSNFTAGLSSLGSYIAGGLPFAFVGSTQLYTPYFKQAQLKGIEYVPVVITNSKKVTPQLRSLAGNGWLFSMITNKCKRPDRVVKLFDYLWSNEGQSLFYGIEGEDYTYAIKPGETAKKVINGVEKEVTYKYGSIRYTDKAWNDIQNEKTAEYGFGYSNIFVNPMYPRLTAEKGNVLNSRLDYIDYNLKSAITDYSYYHGAFECARDATKENFIQILNKSNNITNLWGLYAPKIISATSASQAETIYDSTVKQALSMGGKDVNAFDNESFQISKQNLGIQYAWPKNDPNSPYQQLKVTSIYGNPSYKLEIPDNIK